MYKNILNYTSSHLVTLVAVSKTKSVEEIRALYNQGQRIFGENKVQEMLAKKDLLPSDVEWHLIGHLQSNKVKYIAPFVSMIHSVDSKNLLHSIQKEGEKNKRIIQVLLQFHIATEESKFGLDLSEAEIIIEDLLEKPMAHVHICGVMGMASFTSVENQVIKEFKTLNNIFHQLKSKYFYDIPYFKEISMGMSGDYKLAIAEGSTMVRIGSAIFGAR